MAITTANFQRVSAVSALFVTTLLGACSGTNETAWTGAVTRDSAGITIVENSAALWPADAAWRISDSPTIDIGGNTSDSSLYFGGISGVHRLSDGSIAVFDGGSYSLRFYSSAGKLQGKVGRRGSGPGEFEHRFAMEAISVSCATDTIYTVVSNARLHAFASPDKYARTFKLSVPGRPQHCLDRKLVALHRKGDWPTTTGVRRDSMVFRPFTFEGDTIHTEVVVPWQDNQWVGGGSEGVGYSPLPFGRRLAIAARGSQLVTAIGDAFEIEIRDTSFRIKKILRGPARERPVTGEDIAFYKTFVADGLGPDSQDERRELDNRMTPENLPKTWPTFGEVRIDAAGNIWAREYNRADLVWFHNSRRFFPGSPLQPERTNDGTRWTVLNGDGVMLGEVLMPPRFEVREIGADWILGIWRDDLDVEHVRVYGILKGRL